MRTGDAVRKQINSSATKDDNKKRYPEEKVFYSGKVIYVHPKGRFFTAEFQFRNGSIRETYYN